MPDEPVTQSPSGSEPATNLTVSRLAPDVDSTMKLSGSPRMDRGGGPTIPGYEVLGQLGKGAMGVVYKAIQRPLTRLVALKMIRGATTSESRSLVRFLAEAEAASAISHENVVRVFEYGEVAGEPFLVLEYLPGGSLADRLRQRKTMSLDAVVDLLTAIARGVAAAHRLGIVHRDLKPDNILFDENDVPKVSDFGLAKLRSGVDVTATQEMLGTPAYMSPEQARGESKFVGPESDVWALGVILYEALTGRRPFESDSSWGILQEILTKEPLSLRHSSNRIPRDLEVVCQKCLAKEPHRRYATAEQFADDLDRIRSGIPVSARPVSVYRKVRTWFRQRPAVTAVVMATLVAVVCIAILLRESQEQIRGVREVALVEKLRTVSPEEVPLVGVEMEPYAEVVHPRVLHLLNDPNESPAVRLNAALLLAKSEPEAIEYLWKRLPSVPVRELRSLIAALADHARQHPERYWERLHDVREVAPAKVRYAAVLAAADTHSPAWNGVANELSNALVDQLNGGDAGEWARLFKEVRTALHDRLMTRMVLDPDGESGLIAAAFLATLYEEEPMRLATDLELASLSQSSRFYRSLSAFDDRVFPAAQLASAARREQVWKPSLELYFARLQDEIDSQIPADSEARSRVRPALALLAKGRGEAIWPLFEPSPNPRIRSYLIEYAALCGIEPTVLFQGIDAAKTPGIRAGLILAVGSYPVVRFTPLQYDAVCDRFVYLYETDPDAGVHSACRWALNQFAQSNEVRAIDRRMTSTSAVPGRNWMTTPDRTTFALISSHETVIGSPPTEWNRDLSPPKAEDLTRVLIPRTTAIATTEVTFEQYQRFVQMLAGLEPEKFARPSFPAIAGGVSANDWSFYASRLTVPGTLQMNRYFKQPECPMGLIPRWLAMAYCRWLGDQQGIPEEEQPYAPVGTILIQSGTGNSIRTDYLKRTGYRLPTEAEWESGARAGARTRYPFGSDELLVPKYAVCAEISDDRSMPVGHLKPNVYGLFDVTGNAREWCHGDILDSLPLDPSIARLDDGLHPAGIPFAPLMPRSSSFSGPRCDLRTSQRRHRFEIQMAYGDTGFRLARTVRESTATPATLNEIVRVRLKGTGTFRVKDTFGVVAISPREGKLPAELSIHIPLPGQWVSPAFATTIENLETGEQLLVTRERGEPVRMIPQRRNEQGQVFSLILPATVSLGRRAGVRDDLLSTPIARPFVWTESPGGTGTIEKPYGLSTHEVTFSQFEKFASATNYRSVEEVTPPQKRAAYIGTEGAWKDEPGTQNWITYGTIISPLSPVTHIAPADVKAYCEWLESKSARKYRLPTEVEWEHACRAGTTSIWPFSDNVMRLSDYAWYRGNCIFVQEVGKKRPNRFGLYDMLGNIGEWCTASNGFVLRGQDISADHLELRPEARLHSTDGRATNLTGFRVACEGWTPTFVAESLPHQMEFSPAPGVPSALIAIEQKERHPKGVLVPTDSFISGRGWWFRPNEAGAFAWNTASLWSLNYLDWNPKDEKALVPNEADWTAAKDHVLRTESRPEALFNWTDEAPLTLQGRPLGITLETDLDLPAGVYEFAVASGSGHRIFVDGQVELDVWSLNRYIANRAEVTLTAGRHRIRIETHKRDQIPDLRFGIRLLRYRP